MCQNAMMRAMQQSHKVQVSVEWQLHASQLMVVSSTLDTNPSLLGESSVSDHPCFCKCANFISLYNTSPNISFSVALTLEITWENLDVKWCVKIENDKRFDDRQNDFRQMCY